MTTSFTYLGRAVSRRLAFRHRFPAPSRGKEFGAFLSSSSSSAAASSSSSSSSSSGSQPSVAPDESYDETPRGAPYDSRVLDGVERTLSRVLSLPDVRESASAASPPSFSEREDLSYLQPASLREAVGVARYVRRRLDALERNGDCRRCWLQEAHCVCGACPPLEEGAGAAGTSDAGGDSRRGGPMGVRRLFVLTHHKEVGMVVDTAKLILAAFPHSSRLVISGIDEEYQDSMKEMKESFEGLAEKGRCMILFPSEDARTFGEIATATNACDAIAKETDNTNGDGLWDIIIIDGTWAQARKMYNKYFPAEENGGPIRVRLSDDAVRTLGAGDDSGDAGRQLRRHPIRWREVSTFEATRLLLKDMAEYHEEDFGDENTWDKLAEYQRVADEAARRQLGPKRLKKKL